MIDIVVEITVVSIIKERTNYEKIRRRRGLRPEQINGSNRFIHNTNFASKIKRLMV